MSLPTSDFEAVVNVRDTRGGQEDNRVLIVAGHIIPIGNTRGDLRLCGARGQDEGVEVGSTGLAATGAGGAGWARGQNIGGHQNADSKQLMRMVG